LSTKNEDVPHPDIFALGGMLWVWTRNVWFWFAPFGQIKVPLIRYLSVKICCFCYWANTHQVTKYLEWNLFQSGINSTFSRWWLHFFSKMWQQSITANWCSRRLTGLAVILYGKRSRPMGSWYFQLIQNKTMSLNALNYWFLVRPTRIVVQSSLISRFRRCLLTVRETRWLLITFINDQNHILLWWEWHGMAIILSSKGHRSRWSWKL